MRLNKINNYFAPSTSSANSNPNTIPTCLNPEQPNHTSSPSSNIRSFPLNEKALLTFLPYNYVRGTQRTKHLNPKVSILFVYVGTNTKNLVFFALCTQIIFTIHLNPLYQDVILIFQVENVRGIYKTQMLTKTLGINYVSIIRILPPFLHISINHVNEIHSDIKLDIIFIYYYLFSIKYFPET